MRRARKSLAGTACAAVAVAMGFAVLSHSAATLPVENRKAGPTIDGLPLVPKGVRLGMSLADLKKIRPDVRRSGFFVKPSAQDAQLKDGTWFENSELPRASAKRDNGTGEPANPFAQVKRQPMWDATYGFKHGKCVLMKFEWYGLWKSLVQKREQCTRQCVSKLGRDFELRGCVVWGPKIEHTEPILTWKAGDALVSIVFMPDFTEVRPVRGRVLVLITGHGDERKRHKARKLSERERKRFTVLLDAILPPTKEPSKETP